MESEIRQSSDPRGSGSEAMGRDIGKRGKPLPMGHREEGKYLVTTL